ncbi:MAG: acyl carrier protein [Lachnospiraceae bacterium]|nr:acyl carrier protein [Lachnospiraceae bacterium]
MSDCEKLKIVEELLELESGSIKTDTKLVDIEEWDSLAVISLLAYLDTEYNKKITSSEVKKLVYIKDIMNLI